MSVQYDLYLEQHKGNVLKGLRWIQENLPDMAVGAVEWQIEFAHDESKSNPDEYEAYDRYFYGGNRSYKVVQDFNKAWLLHIHRNPHHWQYWVLINDEPEGGMLVLDMPYNYILEMICDWWSFSWQSKNLFEIMTKKGKPKLAIHYAEERLQECEGKTDAESVPATRVHLLVKQMIKYLPEALQPYYL